MAEQPGGGVMPFQSIEPHRPAHRAFRLRVAWPGGIAVLPRAATQRRLDGARERLRPGFEPHP